MAPSMRHAYLDLYDVLRNTNRFVLNRDAVFLIQNVGEFTPKKILEALRLCRFPFKTMWVEFPFQFRSEWMRENDIFGADHVEASPPSRLGFFIEAKDADGMVGVITPVWSHPNTGMVNVCVGSIEIDTRPDSPGFIDKKFSTEEAVAAYRGSKADWVQRWIRKPDELEAVFNLEQRLNRIPTPRMAKLWAEIVAVGDVRAIQELWGLALYDLASEWRFILALLLLLNSKSCVELKDGEGADLSKFNKVRQKRGKLPHLTYKDIVISLTKVQKNRFAAAGVQPRDMMMHMVRPHFKLRKTGLFLWSEHLRGNIGEPPTGPRTYRVKA